MIAGFLISTAFWLILFALLPWQVAVICGLVLVAALLALLLAESGEGGQRVSGTAHPRDAWSGIDRARRRRPRPRGSWSA